MNTADLCKQAGLIVGTNISGVTLVGSRAGNLPTIAHITIDEMDRLVKIVRNAALEEAAGVCDEQAHDWHLHANGGPVAAYNACAAAIRAMKEQT